MAQQGQWEDKQIISRDWVEKSVRVQKDTGGDDDYGYGWWVSTDDPVSYSAIGRGGQRILVVPAWNLIVVTTGGGFDFDEIEPLLTTIIVDINKTLPANPAGWSSSKRPSIPSHGRLYPGRWHLFPKWQE